MENSFLELLVCNKYTFKNYYFVQITIRKLKLFSYRDYRFTGLFLKNQYFNIFIIISLSAGLIYPYIKLCVLANIFKTEKSLELQDEITLMSRSGNFSHVQHYSLSIELLIVQS